jgi:hypothetical protein
MRRHRALFIPLVALCRRHFSVDFITNMSEFDFRQAQGSMFTLLTFRMARPSEVIPPNGER